jgi:hypothetical protein
MERGLRVHARADGKMKRALLLVAVLAGSASAAPKNKEARKEFDKGVSAYQKGDYVGAADAFARSNIIEPDAETLFAWAQSERKLDHCDKALDLYKKLLEMEMPAENKDAVRVQIGECNEIIEAQKPPEPPPDPTPPATPTPNPEGRAWWKDPIGGALVGAGAVGLGLGVVFLVQGSSAESDKMNAANYDEYVMLNERATSRGQLGVISLVAGGALITTGVVWYATHKPSKSPAVTGWLDGRGGGLAVSGGF